MNFAQVTRAINTVLGWVGLRIVWANAFDVIVQMAEKSKRGGEFYRLLEGVLAKNLRLKNTLRARGAHDGAARAANIAIVVTSTSQINLFELLLDAPAFADRYRPVVVSYVSANRGVLVDVCRQRQLTLFDHNLNLLHWAGDETCRYRQEESYRTAGRTSYANRSVLRSELAQDSEVQVEKLGDEIQFIRKLHSAFTRMLSELDIELLVLFEDNAESETGVWIQAARVLGIASVIMPFTMADEKEPAEAHLDDAEFHVHRNKYNELAARLFPQWVLKYKGRELIRRAGATVIAAEWLGVAQPLPWIHNSTFADAVAVESEAMMDHYRRLGIAEAQLVLTGSLSDDLLHASCQRAQRPGVNRDQPILLCAFPPDQLSARRPGCEFESYRALMDFWLAELQRIRGWSIVVKPHPVMGEADIERVQASGLAISREHTATLIPHCSLYVASVSATIRWALAMGKPVINYDVFRYEYSDFDEVPAVTQVRTKGDFAASLARHTGEAEHLRGQTAAAQALAHRWGKVDGRTAERMLALFGDLAEGEKVTSAPWFDEAI